MTDFNYLIEREPQWPKAVIKDFNSNDLLTKHDESLIIDRCELKQQRAKYQVDVRKDDDVLFSYVDDGKKGRNANDGKETRQIILKNNDRGALCCSGRTGRI